MAKPAPNLTTPSSSCMSMFSCEPLSDSDEICSIGLHLVYGILGMYWEFLTQARGPCNLSYGVEDRTLAMSLLSTRAMDRYRAYRGPRLCTVYCCRLSDTEAGAPHVKSRESVLQTFLRGCGPCHNLDCFYSRSRIFLYERD